MHGGDDLVNHWVADLSRSNWQRFVYVSDATAQADRSGVANRPPDSPEPIPIQQVFPLSTMQVGDRVRIVSLDCGDSNPRLMGMGLMPDVVLDVVSCTATGSVIVALQDQRLGLGAEMAQKIQVMNADSPSGDTPDSLSTSHIRRAMMSVASESSTLKLQDVAIGSRLRVIGYAPVARDYKRKLLAMGLTPGTELRVNRRAPLGDPTEITVRGFQLSLRNAEADALIVEPI